MRTLSIVLTLTSAISAPALVPAFADQPATGTYACFTRGGRELPARALELGADGQYGNPADPDSGGYRTEGNKLIFMRGPLAGKAAWLLPDGGFKLNRHAFCYPKDEAPAEERARVQ